MSEVRASGHYVHTAVSAVQRVPGPVLACVLWSLSVVPPEVPLFIDP